MTSTTIALLSAGLGANRAPLAIALTNGIITAFNPCGFAMLPGYVSYFVGQSSGAAAVALPRRLLRAAVTGATVTAGFMTVFGILGLIANQFLNTIKGATPYISMVVGVMLAVLGIAMLRGFEPKLNFLKINKMKSGSGLSSMYVYGLSYAIVSLSCGFAGFLTTVVSTSRKDGLLSSMLPYAAFSLGMGLVLVVLSFAVAFAQQAFVRGLRKVIPYVNKASGVLMIIAGTYVAYYGYYEWRTIIREESAPAGPVAWVQSWSDSFTKAVSNASTAAIVSAGSLIALVIVGSVLMARRQTSVSTSPTSPPSETE